MSDAVSRDFPIPASPESSTTWPSPLFALDQRRRSNSSSSSRPTSSVRPARVQCLEAAFRRTRPQRRPGSHRPGDTLEVFRPEVLELKQIAKELPGAFSDDHLFGSATPLQTRREVRRLADDAALLRRTRSDQVADDDQSGGDTNAGLQWRLASSVR